MKPTTPAYAAAITLYLAAGGAAQVAWLDLAGSSPSPAAALVCTLPTLLAALLALACRADGAHYRSRLLAAGAVLPPGLLLWSQTQAAALPPVVTALHALLVLGCHAAAVTVTMDRLHLRWTQPLAWLIDVLHAAAPTATRSERAATVASAGPRRTRPALRQVNWVSSLVFR